jgi:hypothetical protein
MHRRSMPMPEPIPEPMTVYAVKPTRSLVLAVQMRGHDDDHGNQQNDADDDICDRFGHVALLASRLLPEILGDFRLSA